MFLRDLRWPIFIGIFVISMIISFIEGEPKIWVMGILILLAALASSTILLTVLDDKLKEPQPAILIKRGTHFYDIQISEYSLRTDPFYLFSEDDPIAELYRGSRIKVPLDSGHVRIGRSDDPNDTLSEIELDPDGINYIWCNSTQSEFHNDVYQSEEDVSVSKYKVEYDAAKYEQMREDLSTISSLLITGAFFVGLYFMM